MATKECYPKQVPKGWTRGERLVRWNNGHVHCLSQHPARDVFVDPREQPYVEDSVYLIGFSDPSDLAEWLKWWKEPVV